MTTLPAVTNVAPSQSNDLDRKHRNQNYRTGHDETCDRVRLHPTHEHQRGCDSANPAHQNFRQYLPVFAIHERSLRPTAAQHKSQGPVLNFASGLLWPAPAGQYPAPSSLDSK
jgi:hypothetical protein